MAGKYIGDAANISKIRHKKQSSAPSAPAANYALSYVDNSDIAHLLTSAAVNKYLLDSSVAYLSEQATPATPASGLGRIFFNTSGQFCALNDAGSVSILGSSSAARFHAYSTTDQTPSAGVNTKLTWTNEDSDSNSWMDIVTNHRFTPLESGSYWIYAFADLINGNAGSGTGFLEIQKNGTTIARSVINMATSTDLFGFTGQMVEFNGSTDYVEVFGSVPNAGGGTQRINKSSRRGGFGGWKVS